LTDSECTRRLQSEVHIVGGERPKRRDLAEVDDDKVACLQTAWHVLSPWQRDIYHHDNRPSASRCVAGSYANETAQFETSDHGTPNHETADSSSA